MADRIVSCEFAMSDRGRSREGAAAAERNGRDESGDARNWTGGRSGHSTIRLPRLVSDVEQNIWITEPWANLIWGPSFFGGPERSATLLLTIDGLAARLGHI
ncbi:hypothetical protein E2562_010551 [Oryza meyeriana var. granulata]|uniref:Uncharacterized protein n=1 Tax=Oryza meyeriana var. granulata TaxID=110450 RepID=A0A6G1BUZ4_9ORYZ|nr:hypothetical protein E2562_010551 [Oryza meyeriana var. granulata]